MMVSTLPTLLLIHGVGDVPNERTRKKSEKLLNQDGSFKNVVWYDWNEAIEQSDPSSIEQLTAIARATRLSARLEYPDQSKAGSVRRGIRYLERTAGWLRLPTMAFFLLSCLWLSLAWAANVLHEEPPPLSLGVRLQHVFFPALDPILLASSIGIASEMVYFAALTVGLTCVMQAAFATAGGPVALRVALRAAVRDIYGHLHWHNLYRPLDYVGGQLSKDGSVTDTRLGQRHHLHIGYWTDQQIVAPVLAEARGISDTKPQAVDATNIGLLPCHRFQYGTLHSAGGFKLLSVSIAVAGALLLIAVQIVWVPQQEKEHLQTWQTRLSTEGIEVDGRLCPQREIDTTGEFPGFERAIAGVTFSTTAGDRYDLEAYSSSRPDIHWDEVQKAVFGQVPSSAFITGLRYMIFMDDPLLEIRECQEVGVLYARSDPLIFRLPPEFHTQPTTSGFKRTVRILLLLIGWSFWWGSVHMMLGAVLGIASRKESKLQASSDV